MVIRSTVGGDMVVRFETIVRVPEGFIKSIADRKPSIGDYFSGAIITIAGKCILGSQISVEKAKVIVWRFPDSSARGNSNFGKAMLLGGASSYQDLVDLSYLGEYLGYQNPDTGKAITYSQAKKIFGEKPQDS